MSSLPSHVGELTACAPGFLLNLPAAPCSLRVPPRPTFPPGASLGMVGGLRAQLTALAVGLSLWVSASQGHGCDSPHYKSCCFHCRNVRKHRNIEVEKGTLLYPPLLCFWPVLPGSLWEALDGVLGAPAWGEVVGTHGHLTMSPPRSQSLQLAEDIP